ncbi:hypothetical protein AGMMS50230_21720 [Spirochaetia bacterium]|nr:hypothetical protein AGMMS50230_21720 [Spirochaetia bacterium]
METGDTFPSMGRTVFTVMIHPRLLFWGLRCILVILRKFFFFQYRAALFPRLPVSRAEHFLDDLIPFNPGFISIYLDFIAFWSRIVGFFCVRYGKQGRIVAADFIKSITGLYSFAFEIYRENLSTTARPKYTKTLRFRLIHLSDPHLMCIPSLHVMIVIHSYTAFRFHLCGIENEKTRFPLKLESLTEKLFQGARVITEAVLYVKQHSINCVAASLYALTRYEPELFDTKDAETFVYSLFGTGPIPPEYARFYSGKMVHPEDIAWLREHIMSLYRSFAEAHSADWKTPLLEYLASLPCKK